MRDGREGRRGIAARRWRRDPVKFRMVDRILAWKAEAHIRGIKTVSFEEYSLKAPFGEAERLPETLMLESLFQLGNWLIILSSGFSRMGLVIRIQRVSFDAPLGPGESMTMDIRVRSYREDGILFDGRTLVGSNVIASGEGCLAVPVPLSSYCHPEDLRMLYDEIYRPEGGDGS